MSKFNVGDVVKLKGSLTKVTVNHTSEGRVFCQWFDGVDLRENNFQEDQLELVSSNKKDGELLQEEKNENHV